MLRFERRGSKIKNGQVNKEIKPINLSVSNGDIMTYFTPICKLIGKSPALPQSDWRIPNWCSTKTMHNSDAATPLLCDQSHYLHHARCPCSVIYDVTYQTIHDLEDSFFMYNKTLHHRRVSTISLTHRPKRHYDRKVSIEATWEQSVIDVTIASARLMYR